MEGHTKELPSVYPSTSDKAIWDVYLSSLHLPAVTVSMDLGIFKLLVDKPNGETLEGIAKALSLSQRSVEALVGVVTALGFLKFAKGAYILTELSRNFLLDTSAYSWYAMLVGNGQGPEHLKVKQAVLNSKAGDDMIDKWESGGGDFEKEVSQNITAAMHSHSVVPALGVASRVDFSSSKSFLDIGAGSGVFALSVAKRYPHVRIGILEIPIVCEIVNETYVPKELADRVTTIPLNMFVDEWPKDYDTHFYSNIFHDWTRPQCLQLAKRSFDSLQPGGRILLHEMLLNDAKDGGLAPASFSLKMLLRTKGKQYTAKELEDIGRGRIC